MKLILGYIRRHLGMFLTALFFLSIETIADLLQPTLMSFIVDRGVKDQDVSAILHFGILMLAVAAFGALGAVMRNIFATHTSQRIGMEMRMELYKKVQTLSYENIDRLQPSSVITRITNDVTQIQNFINGSMRIMMKAPITCMGAIVLIILQTPEQLPMMGVILVISALLIAGNMKLGYPRFRILQRKLDRLNEISRQFLSSIRVVKAFRAEEQEEARFCEASGDLAQAGVSAMRIMAVFGPLINLTVNTGIVVLLWVSGSRPADGIGRLMASVNYMTQVLFSLGMVTMILNMAVRAAASAGRVEEVLQEVPAQEAASETEEAKEEKTKEEAGSEIVFDHVTFSYEGASRPSLTDISFRVRPGETIGIIGPTGSGKSTLMDLVPRFYDAKKGRILIDGKDVTQIDEKKLRGQIAMVPQKALLFSGTIMENLLWGDKNADPQEVRRAAGLACADEFVSSFPEGYETMLGQGGVNLSGGQKQRLSLARALIRKPRILILDDCTSALDAMTESKVLAGIRKEAASMTVLLVSQRIATVMRTDRILCLEDGEIKGYGSHEELLRGCAAYRAIYESQIGKAQG